MAKMSAVSTAMTMNVDDLQRGVKVANDSLKSLGKTAQATQKSVGQLVLFEKLKLGANLAAAGVRTLTSMTSGVAGFVTKTTEALRANIALADSLGISQKQFAGLAQAAKDTGVEVASLFEPLSKIAVLVDNAMANNEQALALFQQLGLNAENIAGLPAFGRIQKIADAIANIKDLNQQSVVLNKIFGESGQRFREFFRVGGQGFQRLADEAEKIGLAFGRDGVERIKVLDNVLMQLRDSVQGLKQSFLVGIAPDLTNLIKNLSDQIRAPEIRTQVLDFLQSIGKAAIEAAKVAADILVDLGKTFLDVIESLRSIRENMTPWNIAVGSSKALASISSFGLIKFGPGGTGGGGGWGDDPPAGNNAFDRVNAALNDVRQKFDNIGKGQPVPAIKPAAVQELLPALKPEGPVNKALEGFSRAVKQAADSSTKLATADDIRTGAGVNTLLSPFMAGFGQKEEVTLLQEQNKLLRNIAAKQQPVPVNL